MISQNLIQPNLDQMPYRNKFLPGQQIFLLEQQNIKGIPQLCNKQQAKFLVILSWVYPPIIHMSVPMIEVLKFGLWSKLVNLIYTHTYIYISYTLYIYTSYTLYIYIYHLHIIYIIYIYIYLHHIYIYMYVYMYVMYVCMYVWMDGWMDVCMFVCMYVSMYLCNVM